MLLLFVTNFSLTHYFDKPDCDSSCKSQIGEVDTADVISGLTNVSIKIQLYLKSGFITSLRDK